MTSMIRMVLLVSLAFAGRAGAAVTIENGHLKTDAPLEFVAGTDELTPESGAVLEEIKDFLAAKSYLSLVRIEGHVAAGGVESLEQALSEARAMAIARWLVSHGIDCERLLPVGFGVTKPVAANDGPERALNTRIAFAPAALRGRLIGGMPADGGGKVAGDVCGK